MNDKMKLKGFGTIPLYIVGIAIEACAFAGCSGRTSSGQDSVDNVQAYSADTASLPDAICSIRRAVRENDTTAFADLVSYPLMRPYPLHDILSKEEMIKYYSTLMDDSLRAMVTESAPERWTELGWRGWMLDNGTVWIDDSLYEINYVSKAEQEIARELLYQDSISLYPSLRKGWKPVACMKSVSHGAIYRIDFHPGSRDGRAYRLSVWQPGDSLGGKPSLMFRGQSKEEGSAGITTYFFASPSGAKAVFTGDITDLNERPRVLFTYPSGTAVSDTVEPTYWLDLQSK